MKRLLVLATLLIATLLVVAGCGADDADDDATRTTGTTVSEDDVAVDEIDGPPELPIQVETPKTFASVHESFELSGTAVAHEGELRWAILDAALRPMASGSMTASCGAPCRGDFSTTVKLAKVPVGSWEMRVFQPPVADDDPERVNDTIIPITVTAHPVGDQPAADAPPPGGVPDDL